MMIIQKRRFVYALLSVAFICMVMMAGCGNNSEKTDDEVAEVLHEGAEKAGTVEEKKLEPDSIVLAIGDDGIPYKELQVYMYILKDKYQDAFGSQIWNYKFGGEKTFRSETIKQVIDLVTKVKIINKEAADLGISLSSDESEDIKRYCTTLFDKISDEDKTEYMLDKEIFTSVYCENEIANKVYDSCINGVNTVISDEDARQCTVQYIYLQTSGINQSGVKVNLSEKNIKERYKEAKKLRKAALSCEDFYEFAHANTEADSVEITFGRGEMGEEFTNAAFALKKGQLSDVITTQEGFYIIYCVEENDKELAIRKKEEMIEEQWKANFEERYEMWANEYEVKVSKLIV